VPCRLRGAQSERRRRLAGGFAVCAGGIEDRVRRFEASHDDYNAIMLKVLADRLAEAFAERLHQRVRREFWGYAADEKLSAAELIAKPTAASVRARLSGLPRSHRKRGTVSACSMRSAMRACA